MNSRGLNSINLIFNPFRANPIVSLEKWQCCQSTAFDSSLLALNGCYRIRILFNTLPFNYVLTHILNINIVFIIIFFNISDLNFKMSIKF